MNPFPSSLRFYASMLSVLCLTILLFVSSSLPIVSKCGTERDIHDSHTDAEGSSTTFPVVRHLQSLLSDLSQSATKLWMATPLWLPFSRMEHRTPPTHPLSREIDEALGVWPAVDVLELGDKIVVRAEMPGVVHDQVKLEFHDGKLTLRGHKREEKETKDKTFYHREITSGSFIRTFLLPRGVDVDAIKANYQHGLLEVVISKPPQQPFPPTRTIAIDFTTTHREKSAETPDLPQAQSEPVRPS